MKKSDLVYCKGFRRSMIGIVLRVDSPNCGYEGRQSRVYIPKLGKTITGYMHQFEVISACR